MAGLDHLLMKQFRTHEIAPLNPTCEGLALIMFDSQDRNFIWTIQAAD